MAWARGHFQALDAEIAVWLKDDAHRIVYKRNEDFTQHYLRAEFGSKPRLDRWPLILGDCVTNLRDALDHLIYTIAHLPGMPLPAKADKAAFIIRNALPHFTDDAKQRLCSVPNTVRDAVLSFQPFNRPHAIVPPLLSILSELANGSKHKLLAVMTTTPQKLDVNFISNGKVNHEGITYGVKNGGVVEDGPFFVVETANPDPNFRLTAGEIHFGIAIGHTPLPGDTRYDAAHTTYRVLMEAIFDEVQQVIDTISALV